MSSDYVVVGRRPLPSATSAGAWFCELDFDEDTGIELVERTPGRGGEDSKRSARLERIVGFTPRCVVVVHPEWSASEAVARELAGVLDGAVFSERENRVLFDAQGNSTTCPSRGALETRLRSTFERACAAHFAEEERQVAIQKAQFEIDSKHDPSVAEANDWSDLDE